MALVREKTIVSRYCPRCHGILYFERDWNRRVLHCFNCGREFEIDGNPYKPLPYDRNRKNEHYKREKR